jgi:hypothetical protein
LVHGKEDLSDSRTPSLNVIADRESHTRRD